MDLKQLFIFFAIVFFSIVSNFSCTDEESLEDVKAPVEIVNAFIIDSNGIKLLATDKGLYSLNESNGSFNKINTDIEPVAIKDLAISYSETSDFLWLASHVGAFNTTTHKLLTSSNSGLHNNNVNHLNFDQNDISYFATPSGLSILKNDRWLLNIGKDSMYLKYQITDLATATDGNTYVTTNGGGVERFKIGVDGISGATIFDTDWTWLKSDTILTVFIDDTVQAYGTTRGVAMHYSESTKWDWENFTTVQGLVNDTVLSIVKDKIGNWWFGTSHGISKYDGHQWSSYTAESHSIISNTIKFLATDLDGSLWFASDKGLSHFKNNQWNNYKY